MAKPKREQLLQASWAVIAERGVHGLRVEDVAAAVGVTNSLVYYHFENRAGLLAATMDYNEQQANSKAQNRSETGYQRVEKMLLADLGAQKSVRANDIVWHDLNAASVFDADLATRVTRVARRWNLEVADEIDAGRQDGSIRVDVQPADAAAMLTALAGGLITQYLVGVMSRDRCRKILKTTISETLAGDTTASPSPPGNVLE